MFDRVFFPEISIHKCHTKFINNYLDKEGIRNRDGKYIYTVYIHLPYIHVYTRLLKRGPYIHVKNVFYNHIGYYYLKQPAHGESITTGG